MAKTALGIEWEEMTDWDEHHKVRFIRRRLLTVEEEQWLTNNKYGPEDLLNGRLECADQDAIYKEFFDAWNAKLGYDAFHF